MLMRRILLILLIVGLALPAWAAVVAARVTVAATPTIVASNYTGSPKSVGIINQCTASVYLGGSDVATTTGLELTTLSAFNITLPPGDVLYGIVATSTCRVDTISTGR
jgi:hypothetical protein